MLKIRQLDFLPMLMSKFITTFDVNKKIKLKHTFYSRAKQIVIFIVYFFILLIKLVNKSYF